MYCLFGKRRGKNAVFVVCGLQACASRRIFDVGAGFRRARNGRGNYFLLYGKRQEKSRQEKSPRARACKNQIYPQKRISRLNSSRSARCRARLNTRWFSKSGGSRKIRCTRKAAKDARTLKSGAYPRRSAVFCCARSRPRG